MAYSRNGLQLVAGRGSSTGAALWTYRSADTVAAVKGAAYISDGGDVGLKVGDLIIISDDTTPASGTAVVDAVAAGGAAELT